MNEMRNATLVKQDTRLTMSKKQIRNVFKVVLALLLVMTLFNLKLLSYLLWTDWSLTECLYLDDEPIVQTSTEHNTPPKLLEMTTLVNRSRNAIFFLETRCRATTTGNATVLYLKQACAIESAARTNPNSDVYVLFVAPFDWSKDGHSPAVRQLLAYKNVHMRYLNFKRFTRNTPIDGHITIDTIARSSYPTVHLSDILRFVTLWKYGGTYLDLDMIMFKTLEDLPPNYVGAESGEDLAVGVMNFDRNGIGHRVIDELLMDLKYAYDPNGWSTNGNGALTRLFNRICGTLDVTQMRAVRCRGFEVLAPGEFYAIPYKKWRMFFDAGSLHDVLGVVKRSRGVHVWNHFSAGQTIDLESRQAYGVLARTYCPAVFNTYV